MNVPLTTWILCLAASIALWILIIEAALAA